MIDKNGLDLLCDMSVLHLCLRPSTNRKVVDPRTDRPTHVKASGAIDGKDLSGTLLGHPKLQESVVGTLSGNERLSRNPVSFPQHLLGKIINGVLPIGMVLSSPLWNLWSLLNLSIPLTELLKGEGSMAEDLCGDVPSCIHLKAR